MDQKPSIGRIVHYRLKQEDVDAINRRRKHAAVYIDEHRAAATGVQIHVGNEVEVGQTFPMVIVAVWGDGGPTAPINGQTMLDGNDLFWTLSVSQGEGPGTWSWPPRV